MSTKIVLAVPKSTNSKTGLVAATYAPIQSCPSTCPFIDGGCYAQHGHCGIHLKRLNKNAIKAKATRPVDIARIEAEAIRNMDSNLPLRLHIVGDCKTPKAAEIISIACKEYTNRTKQKVWTYTHAWKTIPRKKWGDISVLASCESIEDAKLAMKRGYAASAVRAKLFSYPFDYQGVRMVPCLEMTKGITCNKCGLCFNDNKLLENKQVICFFPHGSGANKARQALFPNTNQKLTEQKTMILSNGTAHKEKFKQLVVSGDFMKE